MLAAERAILTELDTVGVVLLILESIVVPLLALAAGQCDLHAHDFFLLVVSKRDDSLFTYLNKPPNRGLL